jgi:hypothetical protein
MRARGESVEGLSSGILSSGFNISVKVHEVDL